MKEITYLSFGAGVQSTALLVMSNLGLHDCPRADVAIFADTGDEPSWVYENVARLKEWSHRIPVVTVQKGHLSTDVLEGEDARTGFVPIPIFSTADDGRENQLRRQCTWQYKIKPIERWVREYCGLKKGERAKGVINATALIGISLDEATRMKPSRTAWVTNRYPLVDAGLRRGDCLDIVAGVGLEAPQKSSCVYCPYHGDEFWRLLQKNHPEEFTRACAFDASIRNMSKDSSRGQIFIHRSLKPLGDIDFNRQGRLFPDLEDEECEGGCFL